MLVAIKLQISAQSLGSALNLFMSVTASKTLDFCPQEDEHFGHWDDYTTAASALCGNNSSVHETVKQRQKITCCSTAIWRVNSLSLPAFISSSQFVILAVYRLLKGFHMEFNSMQVGNKVFVMQSIQKYSFVKGYMDDIVDLKLNIQCEM